MQEQKLNIPGPAGELECIVSTPDNWQPGAPLAICCHPHPLHGGTMQNKVVHILAKTFTELGAKVVRFNFRGAGKSQGSFDHGNGEQADLLAVATWLRQLSTASPLWLAGFSFGAFVSLSAHAQLRPQRLVIVAPPVDMYPAIKTISVSTPDWVLIQGGQDEVVDPATVDSWANSQSLAPHIIWLDDAGHFFHGKLTELHQRILEQWS